MIDRTCPHSRMHPLDQRAVLGADLVVERDVVRDPRFVRIRCEEVVEVAVGPVGGQRDDGPIEKFGRPGMTLIVVFGKSR